MKQNDRKALEDQIRHMDDVPYNPSPEHIEEIKQRAFQQYMARQFQQTEVPEGTTLPGRSLVYTAAGDVFYAEDYAVAEPLTGVISDPPTRCVTDAAALAREAMDAGERVLLIYIDGLGYERFRDAAAAGEAPNLAALTLEKCASVYPTITPVNYAAMVSGLPPAENGVDRRGVHALTCETIFSDAAARSLVAFAAEGDSQILALPGAELDGVHSGLHFLLTLPGAGGERAMVEAAARQGVRLRGLSEYYLARPEQCRPDTVVAGYSALREEDVEAVAQALARAWLKD